jgi:hypothetical protein
MIASGVALSDLKEHAFAAGTLAGRAAERQCRVLIY